MKRIEVLGAGCANCKLLYNRTRAAAEELGLEFEIEKVTDLNVIMGYHVLSTPALVVDGVVKVAGRVPSPSQLKEMLA